MTCKHGTAEDKTESIIFVEMAGYVVVYSPPNVLHFIDARYENHRLVTYRRDIN